MEGTITGPAPLTMVRVKDSIRLRLEKMVDRYEEVGRLLADPAVIGRQREFRELSMEYARLTPTAEKFGAFRALERELDAAREMQADSDPAMREMGQEELTRLGPQVEQAEGALKMLLIPRDSEAVEFAAMAREVYDVSGAGDTVVVEAAGGGVGTLLVQIARRAGARVVALASQPRKLALARDLGADVTVDYSRDGWERQVHDAVGEVDVVLDGVGGDIGLAAFGLLRAGGRFCPFGMASGRFASVTPELAQDRQVTVQAGAGGSPEHLAALARMALAEAAAGRLRPVIGQEFELPDAARAHAAIEARETVGKTLLTVPR